MEFKFDPAKSAANLHKHKIDFKQAQELWNDEYAAVIDARSDSEPRQALIACRGNKIWIAFFTERSSKVRIISVRRARPAEDETYHESRRTG